MDLENLTKELNTLRARLDLEDGLRISRQRNETDLDSIEVGNSKTGKFKMYFNINENNPIELERIIKRMADATSYANKLIGVTKDQP